MNKFKAGDLVKAVGKLRKTDNDYSATEEMVRFAEKGVVMRVTNANRNCVNAGKNGAGGALGWGWSWHYKDLVLVDKNGKRIGRKPRVKRARDPLAASKKLEALRTRLATTLRPKRTLITGGLI